MERFGIGQLSPLMACILVLGACGSDDSVATGDGMVTEAWSSYCVATFSETYDVDDGFGDALFRAHPGDRFLLTEYGSSFGADRAELAYLTRKGPYDFTIEAPMGTQEFPFTTDCQFENTADHYAVFDDVTVYVDPELTTELCTLQEGTVLPAAGGQRGYSVTDGAFGGSSQVYEVYLDAFSPQCGNAERGYVDVPQINVLGTHTWLVPIVSIIGPR